MFLFSKLMPSWNLALRLFEFLNMVCFIQSAACHPQYVALLLHYVKIVFNPTFLLKSLLSLFVFFVPVTFLTWPLQVCFSQSDLSFVFFLLCLWSTTQRAAEQLRDLMFDCMQLFVSAVFVFTFLTYMSSVMLPFWYCTLERFHHMMRLLKIIKNKWERQKCHVNIFIQVLFHRIVL